jgi:hypothetical protein
MSGAKGNGHDPLTVEMVEILRQIRDDIHGLREDLAGTNMRIDALKTITERAHRHIHERIDEAHEEAIGNTQRLTDHDGVLARLDRLEAAVFKKTGS